ncbi:phage tail protein [Pseudonocardia sp.]|uniref:phage tail protein n=1 Tax=Pseudonocardia sp. TaxID=60912 RepID=UPI0031FD6B5A
MTEPSLATATYPLAAYAFHVVVDGQDMSFSEVTGLSAENEVVVYEDGMSFWLGTTVAVVPSGGWVPLTLRRGTVAGVTALGEWVSDRSARHLQISLRAADGTPKVIWTADRAVPVRLVAPTFDATTNDVAVETLELLATGIRVEHR